MSLPADFSDNEHLQSVIRSWQNREIREYFSDLGGGEWDPDITTPRGSLRQACTHQDGDSLLTTALRWQLFERIRRQTFDSPYYGLPVTSFQESRRFQPQIKLYFREDLEDVEPGYPRVEGEISIRLMGYTSDTLTPAVATTFANRVRSEFGDAGHGFIWRKGKDMATYTDWGKGYQLQLLTRTLTDAQTLIAKVLNIQTDTPSWAKLNYSENQEPANAYPTIPPTDYVYGESRRLPRKRPVADCRFQYALLHLHGVQSPIVLYDRSYSYSTALVAV